MLCKVFLVSLVMVAVLLRVLYASTDCTGGVGGSCQPMAISKALSDPASGHQLHYDAAYAVGQDIRSFEDPFVCTSSTDSLPEVRNLSVSLFPDVTAGYYSLFLQWNTDGNSNGYYIQMLDGSVDPSSSSVPEYYKTRISDPAVGSVLLKRVNSYPFNQPPDSLSIRVQPNSHSGMDCVTLTVPVINVCEGFVYNEQCSHRIVHTPLKQFQVQTTLLSDESQDLPLMSVRLSWENTDSVMIAFTVDGQRTDCNVPGRTPPCFITSNTNSVTISPLSTSSQYKVTLHKFNSSPCITSVAHLFSGCGKGYCCIDYSQMPLPPPTAPNTPSVTPATTIVHSSVRIQSTNTLAPHLTTLSPGAPTPHLTLSPGAPTPHLTLSPGALAPHLTLSPGALAPHLTLSPGAPAPHLTLSPGALAPHLTSSPGAPTPHLISSSGAPTPPEGSRGAFIIREGMSPDQPNGLLTAAIVVPLVIVVVTISVVIVALFLYKLSRKLKHPLPDHITAPNTPPSVVTVISDSSTLPDIELSSLSSEFSNSPPVIVQPQPGYWYPPVTTPPPNSDWLASALVLYSPNTPEDEIENIVSTLVVGLSQYRIQAKSPDTCIDSASISAWLEKEVKTSAVLLVCNEALKRDWENERSTQLVSSLKQLLHGSVVGVQGLANFATVLMSGYGESRHVPSTYLNPQKQFTISNVEDIKKISHFVLKVPLYQSLYI